MRYYKRDQFVNVMKKMAAETKLQENITISGEQPSPPPKKEGPSTQQASPPSILMADVNERSAPGTQGDMKPTSIEHPDEMKPTSPYKARGPEESMSADAESEAKEEARGNLGDAFKEFNAAHSQTQKDLRAIFENYGTNSAATSEQAKVGQAKQLGFLDELKKIASRR